MQSKIKGFSRRRGATLFLAIAAALCLGVLSLLFAMKQNRLPMLQSYFSNPWILVLNLLPGVLLAVLFFALFGSAAPAFAATGAVVMGCTWVNWFKLQFRNDPFVFEDVLLVKEAGNMAGKYQLFVPKGLVLTVLCIVSGTVFLYVFARWKPSRRERIAAGVIALALLFPLRALYFSNAVYSEHTQNNGLINQWDATQVYQSKGFVYPFLYSLKAATAPAPEGYSAPEAAARLASYPNGEIPEGKKVNIIAVMLESYCDFTDVPNAPEVSPSVYAPLHALEGEGISGKLVTNIFAGGTINSERSFLTGFPTLPTFNQATNSYVWYLRSQGYRAVGSHPGYEWFYQRGKANANMGFEEYLFQEDHFGALAEGGIASDDILFPELMRLCDGEREPYFSFTVTYQGHGPYPDGENVWGGDFIVNNGYSEQEYNILNNYFGSIENTGRNLEALAGHLRQSDSPTVLLVFGDHKPWLGDNESVYQSLGMPVACDTPEGFLCHYSTQYLIWGNDAAKRALGRELRGDGPTIGPSMLMCTLFDALGWEGPPFMQEQRGLMEAGVTMYHAVAKNVLLDGELYDLPELPAPVRFLVQDYFCDAYYERKHFAY